MCLAWCRSYFHNWNPALVDIPRRWKHQVALFIFYLFIYYIYKWKFSFNIRLLGNKCHLCKEGPLHCTGAKESLFKASIVNLVFTSSYRIFCFKGARTRYKYCLFLLWYSFQSWEKLTCSQKACIVEWTLNPREIIVVTLNHCWFIVDSTMCAWWEISLSLFWLFWPGKVKNFFK